MTSLNHNEEPIKAQTLERDAEMLRRLHEQAASNRAEWIDIMLDTAKVLVEARNQFADNAGFGHWLIDKELDYWHQNDRAALINMGRNPEVMRHVLEETESISPQLIWEKVKGRFTNASKTPDRSAPPQQNVVIPPPEPEKPDSDPLPTPKIPAVEEAKPEPPAMAPSLARTERGEDVARFFLNPQAQGFLGSLFGKPKIGKEIRELVLQAIDERLITEPSDAQLRNPTLKLLLPMIAIKKDSPYAGMDLTDAKDRKRVREEIFPAIRHRRALFDETHNLFKVENEWRREQNAIAKAKHEAERLKGVRDNLPVGQKEDIVMYGERLWPSPDRERDWYQIVTACRYFDDLNRELIKLTPPNRALAIRHTIRWPREYADVQLQGEPRTRMLGLWDLVSYISQLLERNPDAPCKPPSAPTAAGKF